MCCAQITWSTWKQRVLAGFITIWATHLRCFDSFAENPRTAEKGLGCRRLPIQRPAFWPHKAEHLDRRRRRRRGLLTSCICTLHSALCLKRIESTNLCKQCCRLRIGGRMVRTGINDFIPIIVFWLIKNFKEHVCYSTFLEMVCGMGFVTLLICYQRLKETRLEKNLSFQCNDSSIQFCGRVVKMGSWQFHAGAFISR